MVYFAQFDEMVRGKINQHFAVTNAKCRNWSASDLGKN
jgi:hypothetical protein